MTRPIWISTIAMSCLLSTGCATVQSVPGKMKALVFHSKDDVNDPLANINDGVADSFNSAQKELKTADKTMLTFARWREDMGDYPAAKEKYRNILADNPHNVDARLGIARVEYATGRVSEAIDILNATGRKYPKRAEVWSELGRIQVEREEWGSAIESLAKAVEMKPDDQAVRYQLGVALAKHDRLDEAQPHLAAAVGESAAMYNIGFVLHEKNRAKESADWFRKALASHPDQRTKALAGQMLANIDRGITTSGSSFAFASERPQSTVDVELTSYESYRETPGASPGAAGGNFNAQPNVQTQPAMNLPTGQPQPNTAAGAYYGNGPAAQTPTAPLSAFAGQPPVQQPNGQPIHRAAPQQFAAPNGQAAYPGVQQPAAYGQPQMAMQPHTMQPAGMQASPAYRSDMPQQPVLPPQYGGQTQPSGQQQFGASPQYGTPAQYGAQMPQQPNRQVQAQPVSTPSNFANYPASQSTVNQLPAWNSSTNNVTPTSYSAAPTNPANPTQPPQWRGPNQ